MLRRDLAKLVGTENVDDAIKRGWLRIEERIARPRTTLRKKNLPQLLNPAGLTDRDAETPPVLTPEQGMVFERLADSIQSGGFNPFLLFGVTGSGKTEVYLRAIDEMLKRKQRTLVLVPEIALTPQLANRFLRRLGGGVALFHSGLTNSQGALWLRQGNPIRRRTGRLLTLTEAEERILRGQTGRQVVCDDLAGRKK